MTCYHALRTSIYLFFRMPSPFRQVKSYATFDEMRGSHQVIELVVGILTHHASPIASIVQLDGFESHVEFLWRY